MTSRLDRWADPPLLVLASLADEPRHGYAITQDVAQTMGVRLSAGTLYAVIARLEASGLIEPLESEDRRRPYLQDRYLPVAKNRSQSRARGNWNSRTVG